MENYLTLLILLFMENADLLNLIFPWNYISCEGIWVRKKFSEIERGIEKGIERMRLLGPCGSYQRQRIQAQEFDLKKAKQGSAPGSCKSLCEIHRYWAKQFVFKTYRGSSQLNSIETCNKKGSKGERKGGKEEGRLIDMQERLDVSYPTCFLCKYLSVRV